MSSKISQTSADSSLTIEKTTPSKPKELVTGPVTWSIRGVERETRSIIEKGAERSGKTLGQYFNTEIRAYVQGELTNRSTLPSSPKDLQDQITHLTQMVEGIAQRMPEQGKKGFWKRLFG